MLQADPASRHPCRSFIFKNCVAYIHRSVPTLMPEPPCRVQYLEDVERLARRTNADHQLIKGFATIDDVSLVNVEGTGMVGVPGTASSVFAALKEVNVNVVMISQVSALSERGGESGRAQRGLSGREWWTADGIQSYVVS